MLRKICFVLIAALLGTCLIQGVGSAKKAPFMGPIEYEVTLFLKDQETALNHFNERLSSEAGVWLVPADPHTPPKDVEVFERVQAGTVKVGGGLPNQAKNVIGGKSVLVIPAGEIFLGVPFGFDPATHVDWLLKGGGLKLEEQIYKGFGVKPLPIAAYAEKGGWFLKPIPDNVDDFKAQQYYLRWYGLSAGILEAMAGKDNIRFAEAIAGDVPLSFFGGNTDEASMLNGFEFSSPNNDWAKMFGKAPPPFDPIVAAKMWADRQEPPIDPYEGPYYYISWHQPNQIWELWFNEDFWMHELTAEQRKLIEEIANETLKWSLGIDQQPSIDNMEAVALAAGAGFTYEDLYWPEDVVAALKVEAKKLYDSFMSMSDEKGDIGSKRALKSMIKFGWDLYPK